MDSLQMQKLSFINRKMEQCKLGEVINDGIALPFFSARSRFLMMAEAPGREEVDPLNRTPLVGKSGKKLFRILGKLGIDREDFLIINSINCRPVSPNGKNGKPTFVQIERCRYWNKKIISVFDPKIILSIGNYSLYYFTGEATGIKSLSGSVIKDGDRTIIPCIHPASTMYNSENEELFVSSLKVFSREVKKI